jgi:hypothetical protein
MEGPRFPCRAFASGREAGRPATIGVEAKKGAPSRFFIKGGTTPTSRGRGPDLVLLETALNEGNFQLLEDVGAASSDHPDAHTFRPTIEAYVKQQVKETGKPCGGLVVGKRIDSASSTISRK